MVSSCNQIEKCRIADERNLVPALYLGFQAPTGVFSRSPDETVTVGSLGLFWCPESGLLELRHSFNANEIYGDNYRGGSGLNASVVEHLGAAARRHPCRVYPKNSQPNLLLWRDQ